MEITGRTVLLTGASGGLGQAIARDLASQGARLILTARRAAVLAELAEEIGAEVVVSDLGDREDLARLCEIAADVDILVANAGVGGGGNARDLDAAAVDAVLDVNLRGPILLSLALAQSALAGVRVAQIVFIGSLSGLTASPNTAMYSATKFGLRGFSHSLRQDLLGTGIGVSHVAPGFIREAGMFAESGMEVPAGTRTKSPDDVAAAVRRAILTDPAELFVAPPELRIGSMLGSVAPGFAALVQHWVGAADITEPTTR